MQPTPTYLHRHALVDARAGRRRHRPLGVVLIALYGFACAILLSYGLWQGWQFNQFRPDFGRERLLAHFDDILIAVPFCVAIHVLLAIGLLRYKQAARFGRIAVSAANLGVYYLYQSFVFQEVPPQIDLARYTLEVILLADLLILCYLASPHASHLFRARD